MPKRWGRSGGSNIESRNTDHGREEFVNDERPPWRKGSCLIENHLHNVRVEDSRRICVELRQTKSTITDGGPDGRAGCSQGKLELGPLAPGQANVLRQKGYRTMAGHLLASGCLLARGNAPTPASFGHGHRTSAPNCGLEATDQLFQAVCGGSAKTYSISGLHA